MHPLTPLFRATLPALVLFLVLPTPARPAPPLNEAAVDRILDEALKSWEVPGVAVAIVRDDQVIYLKGHGVKELGRKDPVTPDTVFPLASCTKAFTTTAMAMLVDEGKMHWDDHVRQHVDYFHLYDPLADEDVRLRDLVCHRTGVGPNDFLWYRSPWTQEEIIRRIGKVKPAGPFRGSFFYQSTMFTTAGHAVAHAAGMSWADFVQQRLLDPLGMTGASLTTTAAEKAPDHATPHGLNAQGELQPIPWYRIPVPEPAGSLNAGVRDLANWVRFQLGDGTFNGKRLVSAENLAETHMPQNIVRLEGSARSMNPETLQMNYGMAWLLQDYGGHLLLSHAGAIDGFRAHIALLPKDHAGLVILANRHQTRLNLAVSNTLTDLLLGLPGRNWNAFFQEQVRLEEAATEAKLRERLAQQHHHTRPSRELSAYVGTYEDPAYGSAEVTLEDGSLVWHWSTFGARLNHFHYDTFVADVEVMGPVRMLFTLGADGEVASLRVVDMLDVEFKKVKGGTRRGVSP